MQKEKRIYWIITIKIVGALIILIPVIPGMFKEWAYVAFGILLLSASLAHWLVDGPAKGVAPLMPFAVLCVSYYYFRKINYDLFGERMSINNDPVKNHFDKMLVTNSLKAHRLIQMAKTKGLGEKAEERLFYAYFKEGKDLSDDAVLTEPGNAIGLTNADAKEALTNPVFKNKVEADGAEASRLGAKGVPFFVIDRKYAIAGAQSAIEMLNVLQTAYAEWKKDNPGMLQVAQEPPGKQTSLPQVPVSAHV